MSLALNMTLNFQSYCRHLVRYFGMLWVLFKSFISALFILASGSRPGLEGCGSNDSLMVKVVGILFWTMWLTWGFGGLLLVSAGST